MLLSALMVPGGLLVLMMAMQQVQERLLPPMGPAQATYESSDSVVGSASLTSASPSR
ncbi:MAG: hypothetical protein QOF57_2841 [Frankiaceae bacterium]|jgi:hypothetical protein|nr:hypothetical protein [Frankiaceae bacterium]MDQ1727212.1 hypothetical protein [Frankiaceae bacterium]